MLLPPFLRRFSALIVSITLIIFFSFSWAQSVTSVYSAGNIPTSFSGYSATCNGPVTTLTVAIPAGANVTSIDIDYDMTATNGAWLSEQQSQVSCQETGQTESVFGGTGGSVGGTEQYSRTGVTIANGVSATGILTFEMRAWRQWGGSGCDSYYQFVNNNSWRITVHYATLTPMTYNSSTTTQGNIVNIQNCATAAEIIGVEIETSGSLSPLIVSQLSLSSAGTTNLGDISSVNIYYSGLSPIYSSANLFGSSAPGGTMTINGSQPLLSGTNYFWVEYVFNPGLINGNTFDASCNSIVINGSSELPSTSSPAGNRTVSFCNPTPGGTNMPDGWFHANSGLIGSPVTVWSNLGSNANITQLTSTNGGTVDLNDRRANFNNVVNMGGDYGGTFHAEIPTRSDLISGTEVTMYAAYLRQEAPDLVFEFHGSTQTNPTLNIAGEWLNWGFRTAGSGVNIGTGLSLAYHSSALAQMSENAGLVGLHGTSVSSGGSSLNGLTATYPNIGIFHPDGNFMELSIGYWPGYGSTRGIMEAIIWDEELPAIERSKVETYLALKYGITLGLNGVGLSYISPSSNAVIWDATANGGYNFDIAGISRSDVSNLSQVKSHSTNGPAVDQYNDILTVVNGGSFSSPVPISSDDSHFIWGHNGEPTEHLGPNLVLILTDNGEVMETIFQRKWKSQESGSIGMLALEFDLSNVPGVNSVTGANDLANLRLLVDEDGDFTNGATSITPISYDNSTQIAYFQHDFTASNGIAATPLKGYFFTLASTNAVLTPLPATVVNFEAANFQCSNVISWTALSEWKSMGYLVERSLDLNNWEALCWVPSQGNSNSTQDYSCTDERVNELNKKVYYRLTHVDIDGQEQLHGVRSLENYNCDDSALQMYPNPTSGMSTIISQVKGEVKLIDATGKVIRSIALNEGVNEVDFTFLAPGFYSIMTDISSGNSGYSLRFIKN